MTEPTERRANIIQVITSPLGFFALSLLIVEAFLTTALVFSDLEPERKFWGMIVGAGLFIIVVLGVLLLVWCKPTNLTYGEKSHLQELKMKKVWGTSDQPQTKAIVEDTARAVPSSSASPSLSASPSVSPSPSDPDEDNE